MRGTLLSMCVISLCVVSLCVVCVAHGTPPWHAAHYAHVHAPHVPVLHCFFNAHNASGYVDLCQRPGVNVFRVQCLVYLCILALARMYVHASVPILLLVCVHVGVHVVCVCACGCLFCWCVCTRGWNGFFVHGWIYFPESGKS